MKRTVHIEIEIDTDVGDTGWLLALAGRKIGDELKRMRPGAQKRDIEIRFEGGAIGLSGKWGTT